MTAKYIVDVLVSTKECKQSENYVGGKSSTLDTIFHQVAHSTETEVGNNKVTILGIGKVGMACAVGILTQNVTNDLCLVDVMADKLEGEMLDLQHGASFLQDPRITSSTDFSISANSKVIVITSGLSQKVGESRLSLIQRNADILKSMIPKLVEFSPNTILLMVTNPVDVMTFVAWKISGLPKHRVLGSGTNLDSSRFRFFMSERLCVSPNSCHGWIIGEHGDSSVPVWSTCNVGGVRLCEINPKIGQPNDPENWKNIHDCVVRAAYDVIELKGHTSWAIGLSVTNIVSAILRNANCILPLTTTVKGEHGINNNVFLSLPCIVGINGVTHIVKLNLTKSELKKLKSCANLLFKVQGGVVF